MRFAPAAALLLTLGRPAWAAPVSGVVVHQCSCRYACPCMFENGPDDCALAAVYHLDKGAAAQGIDVGGLSMISIDGAVSAHGGKIPTSSGVVYLDARATPAQKRVLLALLRAHGEWPGEGRPIESVPIAFTQTAKGFKTTVPGRFDGEAEQVWSRKHTPITVDGVGFAEGPRWIVGRSRVNDLHDAPLGLHWHLPETNGSWSFFHWTA